MEDFSCQDLKLLGEESSKKRDPRKGKEKKNNCFLWILNIFTEVSLVITALGHLKQISFQDYFQGNEICFKPGNKHGTKSLMQSNEPAQHSCAEEALPGEAIGSHF